ncbi:uncharacterized protein LOC133304232 [Gastrolobium bilobum]|uniref:uncharacterized protein LOC133304232 n=1 Tax=Gastrolobium bilobum TaxID=150636 RepID=UPI002AB29670|nr:uncharacterized protein LOC133304232 [Gastrolobium bilobum]
MADNTRLRDITNRIEVLEQQSHRLDLLEQQLRSAELVQEQQFLGLQESNAQLHESQAQIQQVLHRLIDNNPRYGILGSGPGSTSTKTNADVSKPHAIKLLFPRFIAGDPTSWLFAVDKYCQYYNISEEDRLLIASFHLDDPAACWFRGLSEEGLLPTWSVFVTALLRRFGPSEFDEPIGALAKLQQFGSVVNYQSNFEVAASKVPGLSATLKRGLFIFGLKPHIRRSVLTQRLGDWHDALALARVFEDQYAEEEPNRHWFNKPNPTSHTSPTYQISPPHKPPIPLTITNTPHNKPVPAIPICCLSQAKMQVKRDKGLCFNRDEKFTYGHRCKARASLLYLEGYEEEDPPDTPDPPITSDSPIDSTENITEISFNALFGTYSSKSFRLTGTILGQAVQILIDGGSTQNFITPRIANHLHLTLLAIQPFKVHVGNRDSLTCAALCQSVPVDIQGHQFKMDLFVLELQGADTVLGVQWLASLGPILTDYNLLTMGFSHNDTNVVLQGDQRIQASLITTSQLQKLITQNSLESSFMCLATDPVLFPLSPIHSSDSSHTIPWPNEIQTLLDQFPTVFAVPTSLPPDRSTNHCIPLQPNTKLVQVCPYRYPHFQKNEMEKLVSEMLQNGMIQPSNSAFSSPVLLVKKKDGTWHFCVDYRALNAVIVQDKFPIPMIDALMDELYGATVFSKLDLRYGYHQIKMHPADIHKTTFRTHQGHYEFLVMPFGLSNAPSSFQATMNQVFSAFLRRFVVIFFDDILVYSSCLQEHLGHLQQVLSTLQTHCFFAKLSKCLFGQSSLQFLGHTISGEGVQLDPSKIQAIINWPTPMSATQVRAFLGLFGYYRRFIRHYASIAALLTDLLTKDGFVWSPTTADAFYQLKAPLTTTPYSGTPKFQSTFCG